MSAAYIIASDIPGRIRLRYKNNSFSQMQEERVESCFLAFSFVSSAHANSLTGSVLILYSHGERDRLLELAEKINIRALPISQQVSSLKVINTEFERRLTHLLFFGIVRRFFMPSPIRKAFAVAKAIKFWRAGIKSLKKTKLCVEVLDAAAIGASMLQGDFKTASSIMLLLNLAELLEGYTMQKTKTLLSDRLIYKTDRVWIFKDEKEIQIPMSELKLGDTVIVRTGGKIPIDGTVSKGEATVNQASLTGEPLGVFKRVGDSVFAGTVLEEGWLYIEVKSLQENSRIGQIADMISRAEVLKANVQGSAEGLADKIVPFSFLLSLSVFAATRNLTKALGVLLVDYSCAIKLSIPVAVISAMREGLEHGIMIKGGRFLEEMALADAVVFDKTGTLTEASPVVSGVTALDGFTRMEVLRLAACMEEHFPHSVARAIVKKAKEENLWHEEEHTDVKYIVAHGIATTIHGKHAVLGSRHFVFEDEKIPLSERHKALINSEVKDESTVYLAVDGKLAGFICISDPLRAEALGVVHDLRNLGIKRIIMLTGDCESAARKICELLGISEWRSGVLPADKAQTVEALKQQGCRVIMTGDGINDSPALAAANVSVAMKDSSDIARETADITLLHSDLVGLVTTRQLGQGLLRRIHGIFGSIVSFNTALLLLSLCGLISPARSALLHNLSTITISAAGARPILGD